METLDELRQSTRPKPGCPGTRIDEQGREWYSSAWIDYHLEDEDSDVMPCGCCSGSCYCE